MRQRLPLFLAIGIFVLSSVAVAAVPRGLEAKYSEALINYRQKKFPDALKLLEELIAEEPDYEFKELKALVLKESGNLDLAAKTYESLLTEAPAQKSAYEFELGVINFQQKKNDAARDFLLSALDSGFNVDTDHYLLGVLDYQAHKYSSSRKHFLEALKSSIPSIEVPTHLYLGFLNSEANDQRSAAREFFRARRLAQAQIVTSDAQTPLYKQVVANASQSINALDQAHWFANVGLTSGYDSNVLLYPTGLGAPSTGGTNRGSVVETVNWGLGYQTSSLGKLQFTPTYRGSFNYNFNQDTKAGEYFMNDFTLMISEHPLNTTSFGAKIEGQYLMRMGDVGDPKPGSISSYSFVASIGPYVKHETNPKTFMGAELDLQPQFYLQDSSSDAEFKKSGYGATLRGYWQKERASDYWNPGAALSLDYRRPSGGEFKSKGLYLEFTNPMYLSQKLTFSPQASFGAYIYTDRAAGFRRDWLFMATANFSYLAGKAIFLSTSLQYIDNISNVTDTYQYTRLVGTFAISYLF